MLILYGIIPLFILTTVDFNHSWFKTWLLCYLQMPRKYWPMQQHTQKGLKNEVYDQSVFLICVMKRGKALISWAWPPLSLFWYTQVTSGHIDDQLLYTWNNLKFATGLLIAVIKKAVDVLELTWSLKKVVSTYSMF